MSVFVMIHNAEVHYRPTVPGSTTSANHGLTFHGPDPGPGSQGPTSQLKMSIKHNLTVQAHQWLQLTEDAFVRFKNGGKRLPQDPSKPPKPSKNVIDSANNVTPRDRPDRTHHPVEEGDVGPYKRGVGHLYQGSLKPAKTAVPAAWTAGSPPQFKTDPKHPMQQNRDHQNNQAALTLRGDDPWDGPAITIRLYHLAAALTYEIVGSFRSLYKLNVTTMGYAPNADVDKLLMYYLERAH